MADETSEKPKRSVEHLRQYQFKPGESGNPKGRPKGKSFEAVFSELLDKNCGVANDQGVELSYREALAMTVMREAVVGKNASLIRPILDRIWPVVSEVNLNHATRDATEEELLRNFDTLSDEELDTYASLEAKILGLDIEGNPAAEAVEIEAEAQAVPDES